DASAAIDVGSVAVGSTRVEEAGVSRWLYGADGAPVETASRLAREAEPGELVVSQRAAGGFGETFDLLPGGDFAYHLRPPGRLGDDEVAALTASDRRVRTIVTLDVGASTSTVERVGDRAWGELVAAHLRAVRSELVRFGGEELESSDER